MLRIWCCHICRQPCIGFWGFNKERGDALLQKWNLIPDDVDILLTHGPPVGKPLNVLTVNSLPTSVIY